jgi:hypothetical protein
MSCGTTLGASRRTRTYAALSFLWAGACEKLSAEHVFPAALGGNLELRDGVCTKCNNDFSKFEGALAQELIPIRLFLQIRDRRRNAPSADAVVKLKEGEFKAKANADGSIKALYPQAVLRRMTFRKEISRCSCPTVHIPKSLLTAANPSGCHAHRLPVISSPAVFSLCGH